MPPYCLSELTEKDLELICFNNSYSICIDVSSVLAVTITVYQRELLLEKDMHPPYCTKLEITLIVPCFVSLLLPLDENYHFLEHEMYLLLLYHHFYYLLLPCPLSPLLPLPWDRSTLLECLNWPPLPCSEFHFVPLYHQTLSTSWTIPYVSLWMRATLCPTVITIIALSLLNFKRECPLANLTCIDLHAWFKILLLLATFTH